MRPLRRTGGAVLIAVVATLCLASSTFAATAWSGPTTIRTGFCEDVAAAIDGAGNEHVVASCGGHIRYAFSSNHGHSWTGTTFSIPTDMQQDLTPQIAIDGTTVYVAYNREDFGTCGFSWAGIYYRTRNVAGGAWSATRRIGSAGDHLQSFRVVDGTIHLTADAGSNGRTYYEVLAHGTLTRHLIADSVSDRSALRIGSDGRARVVYEAASSLRYGVFNGIGFTRTSIPGTTSGDRFPSLVLGAGNVAHVLWRHEGPPGCGDDGDHSKDGMYYATNRGGSWTAPSLRRITPDLGEGSLTVDTSTGRIHVLLAGDFGLRYYLKSAGGTAWHLTTLTTDAAGSAAIRQDQRSGALLAVYTHLGEEVADSGLLAFASP